uniref:Nuclear receptor domain-containing protein n=1 Tax=Meloidogyne incognita TaxID=6306 RepID=A0A914NES4_MELIC
MKRNFIKQCKVCGTKVKVCFHYGVSTCRACGAFFRRYLESENKCRYSECNYICLQEQFSNKGEKSETNLADCKKCRLVKCFSVGMKKLDVGYVRQDICREAMEEQRNEINLQNPSIVDISIKDQQEIDSILPIIEAKKRIMHAFDDLDDIFLKGPILFEEIILADFNIFRLTGIFSPNPSPIPFDELKSWESSFLNEGFFNSRVQKCILVDKLVIVGIAKSFPVFEKLKLSDQVYIIYMEVYENCTSKAYISHPSL